MRSMVGNFCFLMLFGELRLSFELYVKIENWQ
jgi:hypothetical protein